MAGLLFLPSLVNAFQELPKAELHLHLGGSYPKDYLFSIADQVQREELEKNLEWIAGGVNYNDAFRAFQLISQIVNTEEKVQKGAEALCITMKNDRVAYAEIRTGLKDLGQGQEAYLKAVLNGIQTQLSSDFQAAVLLSLQRSSSREVAQKTVDLALKYRDQGVVGIDISGDSTLGHVDAFLPELVRAKEAGLLFVVHMGESPHEKDQMYLLEALQPARIGHGVHLSSEAQEWVLKHRTPVEVCLTSSVLVKMVESYDQHPGLQLFRQGHPIVLCTDDPLLFSTSLTQELQFAHTHGGLSVDEVKSIAANAFDHALKVNFLH